MYSFSLSMLFCLYFLGNHCICYRHTVEMCSQRWPLNWLVAQDQTQTPSPGLGDQTLWGLASAHLSGLPPCSFLPSTNLPLWNYTVLFCTYAQKDPLVSNILLLFLTRRQTGGPSHPGKFPWLTLGWSLLCRHHQPPSIIDLPHCRINR